MANINNGRMTVEVDGPFGTELRARVPAEGPAGQQPQLAPARFLGVDGPRWFLRGLVTGPAATETVNMESTATAGEILISPATAAQLPAEAVGNAKGPGFLLRRSPTGIGTRWLILLVQP